MADRMIKLNNQLASEEGATEKVLAHLEKERLVRLVGHEIGADREQWMICYQEELFILFVEWISESAWLEPLQTSGEKYLTALRQIFR